MEDFKSNKGKMSTELDNFIKQLNIILPQYAVLIKKDNLSDEELTLLGDIEHFLIEISGKIHLVKSMLDHDLFGLSLDLYYKVKARAKLGDISAKRKLDKMRETFNDSLRSETLILWN